MICISKFLFQCVTQVLGTSYVCRQFYYHYYISAVIPTVWIMSIYSNRDGRHRIQLLRYYNDKNCWRKSLIQNQRRNSHYRSSIAKKDSYSIDISIYHIYGKHVCVYRCQYHGFSVLSTLNHPDDFNVIALLTVRCSNATIFCCEIIPRESLLSYFT